MIAKQSMPGVEPGTDSEASDLAPLLDDVSEASRLMKSPSIDVRREGRQLLLRISAEYGHARVEAAQARLGLLAEGHMAYWR